MSFFKNVLSFLTPEKEIKGGGPENKEITRWVLDFIPIYVKRYLQKRDCINLNININQLENYKKDSEVGRSIFINFEFDRIDKVKPDELNALLDTDKLEEEIKVMVIKSVERYNKSKQRRYTLINYKNFQSYWSFDTSNKRYQLSLRLFT